MLIQERIKKSYQNDDDKVAKNEDETIFDIQDEKENEDEELNSNV